MLPVCVKGSQGGNDSGHEGHFVPQQDAAGRGHALHRLCDVRHGAAQEVRPAELQLPRRGQVRFSFLLTEFV